MVFIKHIIRKSKPIMSLDMWAETKSVLAWILATPAQISASLAWYTGSMDHSHEPWLTGYKPWLTGSESRLTGFKTRIHWIKAAQTKFLDCWIWVSAHEYILKFQTYSNEWHLKIRVFRWHFRGLVAKLLEYKLLKLIKLNDNFKKFFVMS